ncbi:MAG TPA: HD domain-containing phosphohydrolase, partial [Longimicrobiales bacterium]
FTRGHATRVARYSAILAAAVDPDGSSLPLDALDLGSELHDVGKIAVADGTLNKVGPLEPAEIAEIRLHPGTGRRIVQPLLDDDIVLSIVSWHHERWDGSGYPDGLAGESIPLAARLVALTDSLDAMTSPRAYRPARSWDDAVREIRREAGRQFDPSLMGPFDAVLDEMRRVYEEGEPDQTA